MSAGDGRVEAHYIPTAINCMVDMRGELPESLPRPRGCFHRARWSYGGPPADSAAAGQRCVGLCEPSVDPRRHPSPLPPPTAIFTLHCGDAPLTWRTRTPTLRSRGASTRPPSPRSRGARTRPPSPRWGWGTPQLGRRGSGGRRAAGGGVGGALVRGGRARRRPKGEGGGGYSRRRNQE